MHLLYTYISELYAKKEVRYMSEAELKTTEAQRKAVREYEKKNDRINVIFPAGTRDRMKAVGVNNPSTFIKEVVAAELERMEKYRK